MNLKQLYEMNVVKTTGWTIDHGSHAMERAKQRFPDKSDDDWMKFHRNVVHGLMKSKERYNGVHLIYSQSHDHGVVARVDRKKKHIRYITMLPKGKNHTTDDSDVKLMVEHFVIIG